tara:strand:- start:50 stop:313 length:264 start_codon:yes stop_codon:yes gene_type:complete
MINTRKILNETIHEIFSNTNLSEILEYEILKKVCDKLNIKYKSYKSDKDTIKLVLNNELHSNKLNEALAKDILHFIRDRHNLRGKTK